MIRNIVILLVTVCILTSCAVNKSEIVTPSGTNISKWILSTSPKDGEIDVSPTSDISILFSSDMDPNTLNDKYITIIEAKHSSSIYKLFTINYDKESRKLLLKFNSDYGSSNGIDVTISGQIKDVSGKEMGDDYHFSFATK